MPRTEDQQRNRETWLVAGRKSFLPAVIRPGNSYFFIPFSISNNVYFHLEIETASHRLHSANSNQFVDEQWRQRLKLLDVAFIFSLSPPKDQQVWWFSINKPVMVSGPKASSFTGPIQSSLTNHLVCNQGFTWLHFLTRERNLTFQNLALSLFHIKGINYVLLTTVTT